jgi:hypothetical protein
VAIAIDGYLDYHRMICNKEDCPAKKKLMKTTKFSKMLRLEGENEQVIMITSVLQKIIFYALMQFPNSTKLRIIYALYLLDRIRSK